MPKIWILVSKWCPSDLETASQCWHYSMVAHKEEKELVSKAVQHMLSTGRQGEFIFHLCWVTGDTSATIFTSITLYQHKDATPGGRWGSPRITSPVYPGQFCWIKWILWKVESMTLYPTEGFHPQISRPFPTWIWQSPHSPSGGQGGSAKPTAGLGADDWV